MAGHDIIVIGASAGGVEALIEIVAALPADFPAAVFAVLHFPAHATSMLPAILRRHGRLPAAHPEDGDAIEPGRIYVALPDRHLLVKRGRVRLTRGPRENGHRPALDPLFRTAAHAYRGRVVGVVLTGNLDDGTAGLAAVARHGGVTVVQEPGDALYPGMPMSAVTSVDVDHVVPLSAIPALLVEIVNTPPDGEEDPVDDRREGDEEVEIDLAEMEPGGFAADDRPGRPSGYTCPECHGALWEIHEGDLVRYRCRVGHAYGAETLLAEQGGAVEAALWTAMQALKERASMARRMMRKMEDRGHGRTAARFRDQAEDADRRAAVIREVLTSSAGDGPPGPADAALASSPVG